MYTVGNQTWYFSNEKPKHYRCAKLKWILFRSTSTGDNANPTCIQQHGRKVTFDPPLSDPPNPLKENATLPNNTNLTQKTCKKKNRKPRCEEGRQLKLYRPSTKLFSLKSSEISVLQLSRGESYWNETSEGRPEVRTSLDSSGGNIPSLTPHGTQTPTSS